MKVISLLVLASLLVAIKSARGSIRNMQSANSDDPIHNFIIEHGETDLLFTDLSIPDNASEAGMWSSAEYWPVLSTNVAVLPDGRVITHGSRTNESVVDGRTFVFWTPKKGLGPASRTVYSNAPEADAANSNGVLLNDGNFLVAAGAGTGSKYINSTSRETTILDYRTDSATRGAKLVYDRWDSTTTKLPDGRVLITGGSDPSTFAAWENPPAYFNTVSSTPEIYTPGQGWRALPGAYHNDAFGAGRNRYYVPRQWVTPVGTVFGISTDKMWELWLLDSGDGDTRTVGNFKTRPDTTRKPNVGPTSSAVMFDTGKVIQVGGNGYHVGYGSSSSRLATVVDFNDMTNLIMIDTSPMAYPRQWANAVVLPDGQVLVTGGTEYANAETAAVFAAEIWNPESGNWTTGASAAKYRGYHSSTVLLPNGAIFSSGGGPLESISQFNAEIYYPPYLFERVSPTSPSTLVQRPKIISVSSISPDYGATIDVQVSSGTTIVEVALCGLPGVTHGFDPNQRRMKLVFQTTATGLRVTMPSSPNLAPPGYFYVAVLDDRRVPSQSAIISLGAIAPPGVQRPPTGGGADTHTPWSYTEPSWWPYIQEKYSNQPLKRCFKREFPPDPGSHCAKNPKICFWGSQKCVAIVDYYPTTACSCQNRTWSCYTAQCPLS